MNKIVTITIQARSTSKRFPDKVNALIGNKTVLQRIVESCNNAAEYLNRQTFRSGFHVNVVVCCPVGDKISKKYSGSFEIIEGDENDVLSRYVLVANRKNSDYLVRVTADCPLIPSFVVSSLVMKAVYNNYDYISNVESDCRTTPDGWDCEVISRGLLNHINSVAKDKYDREHVTTYARKNKRGWRHAIVVNHLDLSSIKLSVDTQEEYERIKKEYDLVQEKLARAIEIFGDKNVHRL